MLNVNVRAPFIASQAAIRHMVEGGRIANIGSCMAERSAFSGGSLYSTSKTALIGMTKSLAREEPGRCVEWVCGRTVGMASVVFLKGVGSLGTSA